MQLPFYTLAYLYTGIDKSYPQDGYSKPFQWCILIAALFYTFAGLHLLYRLLRHEYSILTTLIVLISLFYGTNLFYYSYYEPGMTHAYSFFLWASLIWTTQKIYVNPSWKNFAVLSIVISLLVFVRPTNALGAVFIILWVLQIFMTESNSSYGIF